MKQHPLAFYSFRVSSEEIATNIVGHERNRWVASDQRYWGARNFTLILLLNPRNSCRFLPIIN